MGVRLGRVRERKGEALRVEVRLRRSMDIGESLRVEESLAEGS